MSSTTAPDHQQALRRALAVTPLYAVGSARGMCAHADPTCPELYGITTPADAQFLQTMASPDLAALAVCSERCGPPGLLDSLGRVLTCSRASWLVTHRDAPARLGGHGMSLTPMAAQLGTIVTDALDDDDPHQLGTRAFGQHLRDRIDDARLDPHLPHDVLVARRGPLTGALTLQLELSTVITRGDTLGFYAVNASVATLLAGSEDIETTPLHQPLTTQQVDLMGALLQDCATTTNALAAVYAATV